MSSTLEPKSKKPKRSETEKKISEFFTSILGGKTKEEIIKDRPKRKK